MREMPGSHPPGRTARAVLQTGGPRGLPVFPFGDFLTIRHKRKAASGAEAAFASAVFCRCQGRRDQSGKAKATSASPNSPKPAWPPAATTTYCLPSCSKLIGLAMAELGTSWRQITFPVSMS